MVESWVAGREPLITIRGFPRLLKGGAQVLVVAHRRACSRLVLRHSNSHSHSHSHSHRVLFVFLFVCLVVVR